MYHNILLQTAVVVLVQGAVLVPVVSQAKNCKVRILCHM
jgi:hypothetical protein